MLVEILRKLIEEIEIKLNAKGSNDVLAQEFLQLRMDSEELLTEEGYAMNVGRLNENRKKNRYNDIVPFDYSRVMLSDSPDFYINSSYINGPSGKVAYIAAQGPLQSTIVDFWQVLVDQQIKIVVMLCNLLESGKPKCAQYWPNDVGEEVQFGDFSVTLESESNTHAGFVLRNLVVTHNTAVRRLYQFHYTEWPDHGEPAGVEPLIDLVEMIKRSQVRQDVQKPILVHCSAGCGRTGTICALHYCDVLIMNGTITENFSVFNVVSGMRKQRVAMVQNVLQYKILHRGVLALLHQKLNETHEYANIPPVLADVTQNVYEEPDERANSQNELEKYKYDDVNLRPQSDDRYVQIPARASLPQPVSLQSTEETRVRRNSTSFDKRVESMQFAGHQIPSFPIQLNEKPEGPVEQPEIWERF